MQVTCCRCGNEYIYDIDSGVIEENLIWQDEETGEIGTAHKIKCPHCGLKHIVTWEVVRENELAGVGSTESQN